jgi:antitoxin component YwqK of YwqJK toxin-antitoxin module
MAKDFENPTEQNQDEDGVKYHMSGQMYKKMTYRDGTLVTYYENGVVFKKGSFKNGLKDGPWSIYDDRGGSEF